MRDRRGGDAGLGAGGSVTRLALISYSNFSAPTQPARHWPDVMRGDVTPARRPLAAGGAAQLSSLSYFSAGRRGRRGPGSLGGNFSSLLICISLYTFCLSLRSVLDAYLPSHLSFSFPAPLGLLHPFPRSGSPSHIHPPYIYIYYFFGGVVVLIHLFPFQAFIFPRREPLLGFAQAKLPGAGRAGQAGHVPPATKWDCLCLSPSLLLP